MAKALDPTSPRARIRDARVQTIRVAAHDLFTAHGYEEVTIRMVAKRAACSTGLIFNAFPDGKAQLFKAVMGREPMNDAAGLEALRRIGELSHVLDEVRRLLAGDGEDGDVCNAISRLVGPEGP